MAEAGLPEFDASNWFGLVAPANTPLDIRRKIADEIAVFVKRPDVISRYATLGLTPRSSTPEEFGRLVSSEIKRWSEVAQFAARTAGAIGIDHTRDRAPIGGQAAISEYRH